MLLINSSQQVLTPKALHPALVYFHSKPSGISPTAASTNVMCFQSGSKNSYLPLRDNNSLLKLQSHLLSAFHRCLIPDYIPPLHSYPNWKTSYLQVRTYCKAQLRNGSMQVGLLFSAEINSYKHHGPLKPTTTLIRKSLQRYANLVSRLAE